MTNEEFKSRIINDCMDELYKAAQPSISWKDLLKEAEKNPKERLYERYYLHPDECKYIIDYYIRLYNLESEFKDHCDLIIRDMVDGCHKDKYIDPDGDTPGYRSYEKVPPFSEIIGEENLNKVVEFIKMRRDYYRFNREADGFRFTFYNYSPTCNKQTVIDYWKSQGKDIEIVDRNQNWNFERYDLGYSEETIKELMEEENDILG